MITTTPQQIADWLNTLPRVTNITPMNIAIKGTTYPATSYSRQFDTPEGSPARRRGELTYWHTMIYCVGMLPACRVHGNVVFTIDGDPSEWYVVFYTGEVRHRKQDVHQPNKYSPFGNCFGLSPWEHPAKIDRYNRVPHRRVPLTVTKTA